MGKARISEVDKKIVAAAQQAFPSQAQTLILGSVVYGQACDPEPIISVPLSMMNRHGLIAGATGTGKTKTLQVMAQQLSATGVPVFLADLKGDLSSLAVAGDQNGGSFSEPKKLVTHGKRLHTRVNTSA